MLRKILLFLLILIIVYVAHMLITTGYFRIIEDHFDGNVFKEIAIVGTEDITVSLKDHFAIISSTDRKSQRDGKEARGDLYLMDLRNGLFEITNLTDQIHRPFYPHGISMLKVDSLYHIAAINHTGAGHAIEFFTLENGQLAFDTSLQDLSMIRPNDLVLLAKNEFYFTNDHAYEKGIGKMIEDYGGLAISNVVHYKNGEYKEVTGGISYANGINYDPARQLMFVASPRKFLVKVYKRKVDGSLQFIENIPCNTGVDNIEFDEQMNLWIGSHPNLLRFSAYAKGSKETAPSEIIKISYHTENDYDVERIYTNEGNKMSASTVAAPYGDLILLGNLMDDTFLILERNSN